jgi:hypothetical protein
MEKRSFGWSFGLVAPIVVLVVACGGQDHLSAEQSPLGKSAPAYLALGDSVPFGLNPLLVPPRRER